MRDALVIGLVAGLFLTTGLVHAADAPPPAEAFGRLPAISGAHLSPDGKRIVGFMPVAGKRAIIVRPVASELATVEKPTVIPIDKAEFMWVDWVSNDRVLVAARFPSSRYGIDTIETRLVGVNRDGTKPKVIRFEQQGLAGEVAWVPQIQSDVVFMKPGEGGKVLVSVDKEIPNRQGVYEVDTLSGRSSLRVRPRGDIRQWYTNAAGDVMAGEGMDYDHREFEIAVRTDPNAGFDRLPKQAVDKSGKGVDINIAGLDCDQPGKFLVWSESEFGTSALFDYDLATRKLGDRIAAHPRVDLDQVLTRGMNSCVVGVAYVDGTYRSTYFGDPEAMIYESLKKVFPGENIYLVNHDTSAKKWLAVTSAPSKPPTYGVLDIESGKYDEIVTAYPELYDKHIAPTKSVKIKTRDGKSMVAMLTYPWGVEAKDVKNAPAIVMPHGGPESQDYLEFDWLAQFLASRGYLVLQPNFRGSEGYSDDLDVDFWENFGGTAQRDIEDAARWLTSSAGGDPQRLCIVGWSYGGYAALMGAYQSAGLYKCAASMAGVTDPIDLASRVKDYIGGKMAANAIKGDRGKSDLKAVSPLHNADKMSVPILLLHLDQDRNVPVQQGRRMASALKSAGKPYRYVEFEDDTHGLDNEKNRVTLLKELESFLGANIGGGEVASAQ